ncbi:MAG: HAD-IIB family hydrolase [Patescibacteria group bacterium]|nr:HAD-IIB family hydrolase [Patescibacteria group bacterium]
MEAALGAPNEEDVIRYEDKYGRVNGSKKKIVVAVSGGFDPIHIGHIRLFQEARKLGDELVVVLNNDYWLKNKKGYSFAKEVERKEIIESIDCVDRVVVTKHGPNPVDTSVSRELEELRPDIFANGGDRFAHNVPEAEICAKINCKMVFNVGDGGKIQSSSWLLGGYKKLALLDEKAVIVAGKSVVFFDLDGTLTLSKADLDEEMSGLLCRLLEKKMVVVVGGGGVEQLQGQFLDKLVCPKEKLVNLFIQPTSGAKMYRYTSGGWNLEYSRDLTKEEKEKIMSAFPKALRDTSYVEPEKIYGNVLEDRGTQITFSALGQKAPIEEKLKWNKEKGDLRRQVKEAVEKYLPEFEVRVGGSTSVDVTKKGIDKAYGIRQFARIMNVPIEKMVYVGDAIYVGGNDYPAVKSGVDTISVENVEDTKYLIRKFLEINK